MKRKIEKVGFNGSVALITESFSDGLSLQIGKKKRNYTEKKTSCVGPEVEVIRISEVFGSRI